LEVEAELPFAGLSDLVRPILHLPERIAAPRADACLSDQGRVAACVRIKRKQGARASTQFEPN